MTIDTVEITTPDGATTGPIPMDEFERRAAQIRGGTRRQLSFDVGSAGGSPDFGSVKFGGSLLLDRDLERKVVAVGFKDTEDKHGDIITERIHTVSL